MPTPLPTLPEMARLLGGEVVNGGVLAPGPGHSEDDRSLSVKPSRDAECGFVLNSFAGDDIQVCKDHVRQKLKLPEFEPAKPTTKKKNGKGAGANPYSPTIAKYTYRNVDGSIGRQRRNFSNTIGTGRCGSRAPPRERRSRTGCPS